MIENSNIQLIKEDIEQNGIYKIVMREFTNNNARSTDSIDDTVLALTNYGISKNYIRLLFEEYMHKAHINHDLAGKDSRENGIFNVVLKAVEQVKPTKLSDADKVLEILNYEVSRKYIKQAIIRYLQLEDNNEYLIRDAAFYFMGENEYEYRCLENIILCFEKYGVQKFMDFAGAIKSDNEDGAQIELILDEEAPRLIVPYASEDLIKETFEQLEFSMEYELI